MKLFWIIFVFLYFSGIASATCAYEFCFFDNFSDNNINQTFWANATSGSATLSEINNHIEIIETIGTDAAIIYTNNYYNVYNTSAELNWSVVSSGTTGMFITGENVPSALSSSPSAKAGIAVSQAQSKIYIFFYNVTGKVFYLNPAANQFSTTVNGISSQINKTYTGEIYKNLSYYNFKLYNTSGELMNGSVPIYEIKDGSYDDYIMFGDPNTAATKQNIRIDNFSIEYNSIHINTIKSITITTSQLQTCSSTRAYSDIIFPLMGLLFMILGFFTLFISLKSSNINPSLIISSILIVIIGFALIIVGNYLLYSIYSVTC